MAGGTPRGEYILFVLEFAPPISYGITKCVCVGGVVCVYNTLKAVDRHNLRYSVARTTHEHLSQTSVTLYRCWCI